MFTRAVFFTVILLMVSGCAFIFENPVINGFMDKIDVITLPLGIAGTVAGNPVSTYYTTQTIKRLVDHSSVESPDMRDTDTGESIDMVGQESLSREQ